MANTQSKPSRYTLEACRFYKGEDECPYDVSDGRFHLWRLEWQWANGVVTNEIIRQEVVGEYMYDFCREDMDEFFHLNLSLKAFFYARFCHWGGSKKGFKDWLRLYLTTSP